VALHVQNCARCNYVYSVVHFSPGIVTRRVDKIRLLLRVCLSFSQHKIIRGRRVKVKEARERKDDEIIEKDRQVTYSVIYRCVRVTVVALEKQCIVVIKCVCVCVLALVI